MEQKEAPHSPCIELSEASLKSLWCPHGKTCHDGNGRRAPFEDRKEKGAIQSWGCLGWTSNASGKVGGLASGIPVGPSHNVKYQAPGTGSRWQEKVQL